MIVASGFGNLDEMLDVVDIYGIPTGQTIGRSKAHTEGTPHRTAHVWLLRKRNNNLQILFQKRCMSKDSFPGCYDISSAGHIPAGVDFINSAVRELKEELGICVKSDQLINCGDILINSDSCFHGIEYHDRQYARIFILWCDMEESEFCIQKEELDSVLWVDFEEACIAVKNNTIQHCIQSDELEMLRSKL